MVYPHYELISVCSGKYEICSQCKMVKAETARYWITVAGPLEPIGKELIVCRDCIRKFDAARAAATEAERLERVPMGQHVIENRTFKHTFANNFADMAAVIENVSNVPASELGPLCLDPE